MENTPSPPPQMDSNSPYSSPAPEKKKGRLGRLLRRAIYFFGTLWAFGAVWSDAPLDMDRNLIFAIVWLLVTLTYLCFLRGAAKRGIVWLACVLAVAVPWLFKQPSHHRTWAPEWSETGWAEVSDDVVTFHNFRNFDWNLDGTATEQWETRTVHLSKLQGVDYFHNPFAGDFMAHPIISYDFGPDGRVALSIETRREVGEKFSLVGGLYKYTELQYIFGDERDLVRVRTNLRDEPMHLYHAKFTRERALDSFIESVEALNQLAEKPMFYNIVYSNCTTSLWTQKAADRRSAFDYRILINGRLDELIYERGGLVDGGLPFSVLRKRTLITEKAQAAQEDPEFSRAIRNGLIGFLDEK